MFRNRIMLVSTSISRNLFVFAAITFFLYPLTAASQALNLPGTGVWNGFNEQLNVVECSSIASTGPANLELTVKGNDGTTIGTLPFTLATHGTEHLVLNQFDIADRYGTYVIDYASGSSGELYLSCHTMFYRMAPAGADEAVEYAFSIPLLAPKQGSTAGVYNSMNPDPVGTPVYNWLSVYNPASKSFGAQVEVYRQDGTLDEDNSFSILDLLPGERRDFSLGHDQGEVVGLYRIIPDEADAPYGAFLTRYSSPDGVVYDFAFPLLALSGVIDSGPLPASTMDPAINWAEIASPNDEAVEVSLEVRNASGEIVHSSVQTIEPFSQVHVYLNEYLGERSIGSFRVRSLDNSKKILVESLFYGSLTAGDSSIEWAYASQAKGLIAGSGDVVASPINTFLAASDWSKYLDGSLSTTELTLELYDSSGALITEFPATVPAGGSIDLGLHEAVGADYIGLALATTSTPTAAYVSELLRVFPHNEGGIGYIMNISPTIISSEEGATGNGDEECSSDADCNDSLFCNETQSCNTDTGECIENEPACGEDEVCDQNVNECVEGQLIFGTISLVETLGARPPIGQITLKFLGADGSESETVTDIDGAYNHIVLDGWSGTVSAGDPDRVFLLKTWTFGSGPEADAPPVDEPVQLDFEAWTAPIGIPGPEFGIKETHWMYQLGTGQDCTTNPQKCFDFGNGLEPYSDAGNGPYTHYIDNSGSCSDSNNDGFGSPGAPLCSVPVHLPAGSVAEIHGGPYTQPTSGDGKISFSGFGTADKPIFIRGPSAIERPRFTLKINGYYDGVSYMIVENVDVYGFGVLGPDDSVGVDAHHVALRDSIVHGDLNGGGVGITSWTSAAVENVVIYNNDIYDNGDVNADYDQDVHGIAVGNQATHLWVIDNQISRSSGDGIQINSGFDNTGLGNSRYIYVGRNEAFENKQSGLWTKQAQDVIFSQNVSHNHRPSGSSNGAGLGFQYGPENVWFLYNHIYDCDFGIALMSNSVDNPGQNSYFIGNVIHNIHHTGDYSGGSWSQAAIMTAGGINRHFVNNTLYDVDAGINGPGGGSYHMANNIIADITESEASHVFIEDGGGTVWDAVNNLFYQGGDLARIRWYNTIYSVPELNLLPQGEGNVNADPLFVDAANGDLHLQGDSPAIDMGIEQNVYDTFLGLYDMDIAVDFDGVPRSLPYDIGAFEHPE